MNYDIEESDKIEKSEISETFEDNPPDFELKEMPCTLIIMAINIIVYFICLKISDYSHTGGTNYECVIINHEYSRIISSMFLHGNLVHLTSNMIALFIFGNQVEKTIGSLNMIIVYFSSGILSGICSMFMYHFIEPDVMNFSIGASGAIYGLMAAYLFIQLKNNRRAVGKAIVFMCAIAVMDYFSGNSKNVDIYAHLGGAVSGTLVTGLIVALKKLK